MVIFHQNNAFTILNDRTGSEGSEVYTRAHLHTLMSWENCVHYYSIMLCSIYLSFHPAANHWSFPYFCESDFPRICHRISDHVGSTTSYYAVKFHACLTTLKPLPPKSAGLSAFTCTSIELHQFKWDIFNEGFHIPTALKLSIIAFPSQLLNICLTFLPNYKLLEIKPYIFSSSFSPFSSSSSFLTSSICSRVEHTVYTHRCWVNND